MTIHRKIKYNKKMSVATPLRKFKSNIFSINNTTYRVKYVCKHETSTNSQSMISWTSVKDYTDHTVK